MIRFGIILGLFHRVFQFVGEGVLFIIVRLFYICKAVNGAF
uniref:Uncharacterized protein n=1 Tax=CrAss-like virus sp. ctt4r3 TaxID=2823619 RepID=A0A8S5L7D5_9CAUD|nr:MAG TPA: hypothetical protein [CrAss-like virus sp. ctt4r3]